jgi:hypothetical protein
VISDIGNSFAKRTVGFNLMIIDQLMKIALEFGSDGLAMCLMALAVIWSSCSLFEQFKNPYVSQDLCRNQMKI